MIKYYDYLSQAERERKKFEKICYATEKKQYYLKPMVPIALLRRLGKL